MLCFTHGVQQIYMFCLYSIRHWADVNPHWVVDSKAREESIMVWAGIIDQNIIGPFFFVDRNVNGRTYLELLQNEMLPAVEALNYNPQNIIFQQDGAPAHYSRIVTDWLHENIPNWIGRGGPLLWPPRSPDLTPLDFFIWPYVKNLVYETQPDTMDELIARIENAFRTFTPQMLQNCHRNVIRRLDACIDSNGQHFEQML
jgi:hypothetical protein